MCDKDSSDLQSIVQSVPRREPKIMLQRAEYIFPALKNGLVSGFVFVHIEQKTINMYFQKIIFGNFCH
jgi:nitrate reductase NapE component